MKSGHDGRQHRGREGIEDVNHVILTIGASEQGQELVVFQHRHRQMQGGVEEDRSATAHERHGENAAGAVHLEQVNARRPEAESEQRQRADGRMRRREGEEGGESWP